MLKKSKDIVKAGIDNKLQKFLDFENSDINLTVTDKKILSDLKDQTDYYTFKSEEKKLKDELKENKIKEKSEQNIIQNNYNNIHKLDLKIKEQKNQNYNKELANKKIALYKNSNKKVRNNKKGINTSLRKKYLTGPEYHAQLYNRVYETILYDITENNITAKQALNNLLNNKDLLKDFKPNDIKIIINNYNNKYIRTNNSSTNIVLTGIYCYITVFLVTMINTPLVILPFLLLLAVGFKLINKHKNLTTSNHCNELYKQNNRLELTRRNVEHAYLRDSEDDITFSQYAVSVKEIKDKTQDINYEISLVKYRPTQNSYTVKLSKVKIFSKQDYDKAIEYKLELEELAASLENDSKIKFDSLSNDLLETKTDISNKLLEENLEEIENKTLLESLRGY